VSSPCCRSAAKTCASIRDQRRQHRAARADLAGQCRQAERHALPGIAFGLPVERLAGDHARRAVSHIGLSRSLNRMSNAGRDPLRRPAYEATFYAPSAGIVRFGFSNPGAVSYVRSQGAGFDRVRASVLTKTSILWPRTYCGDAGPGLTCGAGGTLIGGRPVPSFGGWSAGAMGAAGATGLASAGSAMRWSSLQPAFAQHQASQFGRGERQLRQRPRPIANVAAPEPFGAHGASSISSRPLEAN
jgi:hypothetical protein